MKKYIIIPCILTIIGHSLFFSIFKVDVVSNANSQNTQLYLISKEQYDYLKTIITRPSDVVAGSLPRSLSNKNPLWKDVLDVVEVSLDSATVEEIELLEDSKSYNFQEIQIPLFWYKDLSRDIVPKYYDLFYLDLMQKRISQGGEFILDLKNKIKMGYYLQGPVSSRHLKIDDVPNIDKTEIKAKFRLWVTNDGRVNQVLIEEGSSFPLVDTEIIDFIKTWRFSPVFDSAGNYEWGIVRVRFFK